MKLGLKDRFSIVKGLLYLILGICCVYLIVTGRYLNYIAPRYELLLGISSVALILGGLATVIWAPSRYYKHNWRSIVPIIIPVVLLIVPPVPCAYQLVFKVLHASMMIQTTSTLQMMPSAR